MRQRVWARAMGTKPRGHIPGDVDVWQPGWDSGWPLLRADGGARGGGGVRGKAGGRVGRLGRDDLQAEWVWTWRLVGGTVLRQEEGEERPPVPSLCS